VIPNPGSSEARGQGCRCPVVDNRRGLGAGAELDGRAVFYFRLDCPLHGGGDWQDRNEAERVA
jgi:hypothetical protein